MAYYMTQPDIRINMSIMACVWVAGSFNYYLVSFLLKYFPGSIYHNSTLSGISEVISIVFSGVIYKQLGVKLCLILFFAIAMIGVGLSAPAAMSQVAVVSGIAVIASTLLLVISLLWAAVAVVLGLAAMLQNGANAESAPTLLILVPLTTVLGILVLRQDHGLHVHFDAHAASGDVMRQLTVYLSIQIAFGLFGLAVLRAQGYFARFLAGRETSVGSYALVCPGVAISVLMQFWINKGLVGAGLIAKFGAAYWALSAVAVGFQLAMIVLVLVLNKRHFSANTQAAIPAE